MPTVAKISDGGEKISDRIWVGKDILELVSSGMYVDPLTIYREYVQNGADAIDEAEAMGLYSDSEKPRIDIWLDPERRVARIRDNGIGVKTSIFARRMTSLGASKKRGTLARGFRGVGRVCGIAYCQELVMRSKNVDDKEVSELRWDCRRFKELLRDNTFKGDISDIVREVTVFYRRDSGGYPKHFFEVELVNMVRYKSDALLNEESVETYLAQVAPVPFSADFSYGVEIETFLSAHGISAGYPIIVNGLKQIVRPHRDTFNPRQNLTDRFDKLEKLILPGLGEETAAVGWLLHHGYHGALPNSLNLKGLRGRIGNIQVGTDGIFNAIFTEPRFNSWIVGELHILSPTNIVPNGRRDDFEENRHRSNLFNQLGPIARRLSKLCRGYSAERNKARAAADIERPLYPPSFLDGIADRDLEALSRLPAVRRNAYLDVLLLISEQRQLPKSPSNLLATLIKRLTRP